MILHSSAKFDTKHDCDLFLLSVGKQPIACGLTVSTRVRYSVSVMNLKMPFSRHAEWAIAFTDIESQVEEKIAAFLRQMMQEHNFANEDRQT